MTGPVIELTDAARIYVGAAGTVEAVRPCRLRIDAGDFVAITGPSGSGKSTLLNVLGLLDGLSSGSYRLAEHEISELTEAERTVLRGRYLGFVFQAFHLLSYRTAVENVELGMLYSAIRPKVRRARALEVLEKVGLGHRAHAFAATLSGGERQRVAIARAIVNGPKVLLCDEPTGSLDSTTSDSIMTLLEELNADGLTIVLVTHDHQVAARAVRRVRIEDGTLTEETVEAHVERWARCTRRREPGRSKIRFSDLVAEAAAWISRRRARSLLTALGTLLGVGAFVATIGVTSTVSAQVSEKFDALKATGVVVRQSQPSDAGPAFFPADYAQRLSRLNGVVSAGRFWRLNDGQGLDVSVRPTAREGDGTEQVPVLAAAPLALRAAGARLASGRLYDGGHERRGDQVAVLGSGAARTLGITDVSRRPGIFIKGRAYSVVGIINGSDRLDELTSSVVLPETAAQSIASITVANQNILIQTDLGAAALIGRQAPRALRPDNPDEVTVVLPPDPQTLRRGVESDLRSLFLLLASVSLIIGAVGIANTTLVSVMERVPEIGLRRSLGAQRRHIAAQFLTESAILGSLGGVMGCILAIFTVVGLSLVRHWTPVMSPALAFGAPLLGTLTGLLAGLYPALKASTITPVRALNR